MFKNSPSYSNFSINPLYGTPAIQSPRGIIHQQVRFLNQKFKYEFSTKIENILTHWSVVQADFNSEKMEVQNLVGLYL